MTDAITAALTSAAQFMDAVREDAKREGWWTEWDQQARDQITTALASHLPGDAQAAPNRVLAELVLEYARDLRRNSSGGDDYPWQYAKGTADYLEEIVRRAAQPTVEIERRCQKCGETTRGEEALVEGKIWCHPCADARSSAGTDLVTKLFKIADASRREDGSDIPLGETLREAANTIGAQAMRLEACDAELARIRAVPQTPVITDEMVKAGAAAICCQAGKLGCAAKHENSEFATCVISTFMQDSRRCLEAALAVTRPQLDAGDGAHPSQLSRTQGE